MPRQGVHIKDARECLKHGDYTERLDALGRIGRKYQNDVCRVVLNPDTGMLIQTNY